MSFLEYISIGYLRNEVRLATDSKDLKRLMQIKRMGMIAIVFALVCSTYLAYLIVENIYSGIVIGVVFTFVYINFYLVLLSTVRKADFITYQKVLAEERRIVLNGVNLVGDGKKYPKTFVESRYWGSLIFRLFFLSIFSAYLSLGGVLFFNKSLTNNLIENYKQASVNKYGDFINNLYVQKLSKQKNRLSALTLKSTQLLHQKDSISQLLQQDPLNEELNDELKWSTADFNDFNNTYQEEIKVLSNEIESTAVTISEKKERFESAIQNKFFFVQRIKLLFNNYFFSSVVLFILGLIIFLIPFLLRYHMLRNKTFQLDDLLQEKIKQQVETDYEKLNTAIEQSIIESGIDNKLKALNLLKWPLKGDGYINPPFNTIEKIDSRTILRKGSLVSFLSKKNSF